MKGAGGGGHARPRPTSSQPPRSHAERSHSRVDEDKSRFLQAKRGLSEAIEAHDIGGLQKAIPLATAAGVSFKDIDAAKRILDFELNKCMLQEVNDVRSAIESLAEAVDKLESRAAKIESQPSQQAANLLQVEPKTSKATEAWLIDIVERIEQRVWEALESKVEEHIQEAVDKAVKNLKNGGALRGPTQPAGVSSSKAVIEMAPPSTPPGLLPESNEVRNAQPTLGSRRLSKMGNPQVSPPVLSPAELKAKVAADGATDKKSEPEPPSKKRKPVEATSMKSFFHRYDEDHMRSILLGDASVIDDTLGGLINDMPNMLKEPQNWGVRVQDVRRFYEYIRQDLLGYVKQEQDLGEDFAENLHVVTPRFIKPWTQAYSPNPLAAVINAENLSRNKFDSLQQIMTAKVFISHCWNENFGDFVSTLSRMLQPEDVVWICAISICQNVDISEILGDSIEDSPFWRAMPHCKRVAMLIDRKAEPFERAWCALEEYLATYKLRLPFSICMPNTMDEEAWKEVDKKLQNFSIRDCKASQESDKQKIMSIIEEQADIIDRVVRHESEKACFAARVMKVAVCGTVDDLKPLAFKSLGNVTDGAGRSIIHILAQHNCVEMLNTLTADGVEPDARDAAGKSPLHLAAMSGHDKFVECLIACRADVHLKDEEGSTPLMTAASYGKAEIGRQLLLAGANIDAEDNQKYTPLLDASVKGHGEVVKLLLEQKANMYAKDPLGHCALTMAAQSGKSDVIKCLIASGLPVDEKDHDGCTALMYASAFGHVKVVRELLDGKADCNVKDNEDYTALNFAKDEKKEECVALLEGFMQSCG